MESPRIKRAMIMTAGLGTRLKPFTNQRTKALLPILGVPSVQFALDSLSSSGVSRVVCNVHHHAEGTKQGLLTLDRGGVDELLLSDESRELLGSAGGLRNALPLLGEDEAFFLTNADVLCDVDWRRLEKRHRELKKKRNVSMTLALFRQGPGTGSYREILFDEAEGLVTGLGALAVGRPFYIGAAVVEPDALLGLREGIPAEFGSELLVPAIEAKRVGIYLTEGEWFDIGSPSLWLETHLALIKRFEEMMARRPEPKGSLSRWKNRIEAHSKRIQEGVWISRTLLPSLACDENTGMRGGPSYLGILPEDFEELKNFLKMDEKGRRKTVFNPVLFSPLPDLQARAVYYMRASEENPKNFPSSFLAPHDGIGMGSEWVDCPAPL